jgi:hypothetical protein
LQHPRSVGFYQAMFQTILVLRAEAADDLNALGHHRISVAADDAIRPEENWRPIGRCGIYNVLSTGAYTRCQQGIRDLMMARSMPLPTSGKERAIMV